MKHSTIILLIAIAVIVVAGIIYRQYSVFRVPPTIQEFLEQDTSAADERMAKRLAKEFELTEPDNEDSTAVKHSIPLNEIISGGPPKDGIPSIDNPKFESVVSADQYLKDDGFGLAIEVAGQHRFYPYQILVWHEIVNDHFNGKPLLVTYCPLCFTGIVFEPTVNGETVEFGTSGKLWNNNLLMYDRKTDSLWSQALGEAVVGKLTGTELIHYPALTTSWKAWKDVHPDGEVLSRNTGALRDYTRDPYGNYYTNSSILFPLSNIDGRLGIKENIYGIRVGDARKAYVHKDIEEEKVINDVVNDQALLILFDSNLSAVRMFDRNVDNINLSFELKDGKLIDTDTNSVWSFGGKAISGPMKGVQLEIIIHENSFWFSWAASFPETDIYQP